AIGEYREWIRLAPGDTDAYERLGNALGHLSRDAEAETAFRRAVEIDPNNREAHLGLGTALYNQSRPTEAEAPLRKAIDLYAKWFQALDQRAVSAAAFEKSLIRNAALDTGLAKAHGKLGEVLADLGWYEESLAAFRQCHELGSKLPNWKYP